MFGPLKLGELQRFVDAIAASVAVIEWSAGDHSVVASNARFRAMLGGSGPLTRRMPFLLKDLLPRYVRNEFIQKLDECHETKEPLEFEQAYDLKDGSRWWRLSVQPVLNDEDAVVRILVTGLDITAKVELERELRVSTSRFVSVIEAAYDGIVTVDQTQRITLFNRAAEEMFGYGQDEVMGQPLTMLLPKESRAEHERHVMRFARSPVRSRQMDERNRVHGRSKDGRTFPIEIAISKINVDGLVEFTGIIRDIADRVRLMDILEQQAQQDELTGAANRRAFQDTARAAFETGAPGKVSLMILDVDMFKSINDTYGHDGGDDVLRALASICRATVRHDDLFARIGGEEFAVLMPDTDGAQAQATAERIRRIFDERSFRFDWRGTPIPFTISAGVATKVEDDETLDTLMKRTDVALYAAKEAGRNRVVVAD